MSTILRPFARTGLMLSPVTLGCSPRAGRSGGRCLANPARPDSRCRPASRDNATLNHRNHRCGNLRRRASHASRRTRSRADEQPEVAQPRCDLLRGERAHPGGGQLERQRHAVQRPADPQHRAHGRLINAELSPSAPKVVRSSIPGLESLRSGATSTTEPGSHSTRGTVHGAPQRSQHSLRRGLPTAH
jgi:hypothetical protein